MLLEAIAICLANEYGGVNIPEKVFREAQDIIRNRAREVVNEAKDVWEQSGWKKDGI